eukprot:3932511-Rhodomonas_salina.1
MLSSPSRAVCPLPPARPLLDHALRTQNLAARSMTGGMGAGGVVCVAGRARMMADLLGSQRPPSSQHSALDPWTGRDV